MDNKIHIPYTYRKGSAKNKRITDTGLSGARNKNNQGSCIKRPCSYAVIVSYRPITKQNSPISERQVVTPDTVRVSELKKRYWGQNLWARGYFCATSGTVTDEMIQAYINNHDEQDNVNDFKIEDDFSKNT